MRKNNQPSGFQKNKKQKNKAKPYSTITIPSEGKTS